MGLESQNCIVGAQEKKYTLTKRASCFAVRGGQDGTNWHFC